MFIKKSKGHFCRRAGFTLIELLVVIAIIGLLATIVLVSLNSARAKARDTKRIGDLRQVALALEMYYDDHQSTGYPAAATCTAATYTAMATTLEAGGAYITKMPIDTTYMYGATTVSGVTTDYTLKATLENGSNPSLLTSISGTSNGCACNHTASPYFYCISP